MEFCGQKILTGLQNFACAFSLSQVYFQSWGELEVHATCVHDSHLLSCPHCPDAFILENTLCQHLKMHNNKKAHITAEEEVRITLDGRFLIGMQ